MHGKTSDGGNMPPYSPRYRKGGIFYKSYKMRSNPLNRGRWDLKHWWGKKYDGAFYRSIKPRITLQKVTFSTTYKPSYMKDIYAIISKRKILGITKKQWYDYQKENINRVQPKALSIINKRS